MKCSGCGHEQRVDLPEGKTFSALHCECGEITGHLIIVEPYGRMFLYGIEALERRRPTAACVQFASAFEVFQKQCAKIALAHAGVPEGLATFVGSELDLPRDKIARLVSHLLGQRLRVPDAALRNAAIHAGQIPDAADVLALGRRILDTTEHWITAMATVAGPDLARLEQAHGAGELPQDVAPFDRASFDLRVTLHLLRAEWSHRLERP